MKILSIAIFVEQGFDGELWVTKEEIYQWIFQEVQATHCPKQTNNVDCGYYVLPFIHEIISKGHDSIPEKYYPDLEWFMPYSKNKSDEIRDQWATCAHLLREQEVAMYSASTGSYVPSLVGDLIFSSAITTLLASFSSLLDEEGVSVDVGAGFCTGEAWVACATCSIISWIATFNTGLILAGTSAIVDTRDPSRGTSC
ncbi:hypothetical protein V2J09_021331 [Rumex salicifolius]